MVYWKTVKQSSPVITLHKAYSADGIELDGILFSPPSGSKSVIVHVHGKEGHFIQNHFVTVMGNEYPKHGYSFFTFNNRGHDYMADLLRKTSTGYVWEQGGSVFDLLEKSKDDIAGVIGYLASLGYSEIILQGHSLGPHKICYYLVNTPDHPVTRLVFLTTADVRYQFDASVPDWEKYSLLAKRMIGEGNGKEFMPVRLWSNCPVSAETFWNYTRPESNCFVFNGTHPETGFRNFDRITLPILVINPENDVATGIPQKDMLALIRKHSASKRLETKMVSDAVHNFLGKEKELVGLVTAWLVAGR